ncbi:uncharacterized protein RAG0_17241 [Rhynchosporium agropyri]|uniref:Uncharacterized protein n=1 Tax=Rhynchosporium agropyri TaxID=914238 RepID=A0A1E1LTC4_9HELO|nr:uncharacterized protein RAG0_17241 [Rhynchosporium agropyri]
MMQQDTSLIFDKLKLTPHHGIPPADACMGESRIATSSNDKHNTDTAASASQALIYGQLIYLSGYGDICLYFEYETSDCEDLSDEVWVEVDEFQRLRLTYAQVIRHGPFRFADLPLEIRLKIYHKLLALFYSYDEATK